MKKTLLEIYALIVCLITGVWSLISVGIILFCLLRISNPDFTMPSYEYGRFQSNDAYFQYCCKDDKKEKPSEDELTKRRQEAYVIDLKGESRQGSQEIIKQLIAVLLNAVVFSIHWKLSKKARSSSELVI